MSSEQIQKLEKLEKEYQKLNTLKIKTEAELESVQNEEKRIINEIKEKYNVNSLDELRLLYKKLNIEVEKELSEFENIISDISEKLNLMKEA